jgi:hypothetical protein
MIVVMGLMVIASCKDDEKPKSKMSFAVAELEVLENDGTVEVKINIDRAVSETVVLSYTLGGTATEFKAATGGDYEISPEGGTITIAPGATEATIEITLFEDGEFEFDSDNMLSYETIILTITGVISGPAELVAENTLFTLFVYEDDMLVFLDWDIDNENTDVDMDLLVWFDNPTDNPDNGLQLVNPSLVGGGNSPGTGSEAILLVANNPDANYGFSYVYYEGTIEPLNFVVDFVNFGGTVNSSEETLSFEGTYQLDNINRYDEVDAPTPIVVQTITKAGTNYTDLTDITEPDTGSRMRTITGSFGGIDKSGIREIQAKKIKLPASLIEMIRKNRQIQAD